MKGLTKAIRLEYNYIKERWLSTLLFMLASALIIIIFSVVAKIPVPWEGFAQMNYTYYDLLAPTIFPLIILFVTVQMVVLRIVGERAPFGTLDRELIAISRMGMYLGKMFVHSIVAFIQCLIVYLFGFILFPVKSYAMSSVTIILLFFLLALFGLSLGMFVSVFSKHKESAVQIAPYLVLGLFITSLILIFPGIVLSSSIKAIFMSNPLALISQSLSESMVNGVGFEDIGSNVARIIFWILGLIVISLLKFKYERK
jgi:hypothetical protein